MIDWTLDDGIAQLALDRAAARNAIPVAAWGDLAAALHDICESDARVLIVRSAVPGIFSAGADIGDFAALRKDRAARVHFREAMRAGIDSLAALSIPTIAAVDGGCYGAAVALALACDMRIAGADARFATTPAKLGIGYPGEDVARLIAQVGRGQASRMLFAAEPIDAAEAGRIGLVEIIAPDADQAARALAAAIAAHSPGAVAMLKRTLADPRDPAHAAAFDAAFGGEAFASAFADFRSRRSA